MIYTFALYKYTHLLISRKESIQNPNFYVKIIKKNNRYFFGKAKINHPFRLVLNSPKIYTVDSNGKEIGGSEFNFPNNGRLDYNFNLKSLPSSDFLENGLRYSLAQVKLNFTRTEKSQAEIFSGFHITTGVFAFLSLISFFIHPDIVPGLSRKCEKKIK